MSVFSPMPLPNTEGPKQNLLAQLMQQHQAAAMRFAGQHPGLNPLRAVAPPMKQPPTLPGLRQQQTPYPPALIGPTIARLRSPGV